LDKWYGLTLEDIRQIEEETKRELDQMRANKSIPLRGAYFHTEESLESTSTDT
jgi:hypothetical protein